MVMVILSASVERFNVLNKAMDSDCQASPMSYASSSLDPKHGRKMFCTLNGEISTISILFVKQCQGNQCRTPGVKLKE